MEYIYTALLLHKAGKEINEENMKKVLEAAGVKPEEARIKALLAALENVDIDEAIKEASVMQVAAAAPASGAAPAAEEKKEEAKEEKKEEKSEEEAAAGLGALFG
ncbi:MAG: large subunit ribosomal protein [Candidatus Woesearchaeota archaeon]|nr:large subunit ribosomal protein [Candidatus Woesearchaeota archaeon]MDN5327456.1 large subunit ribosomal protein [Candidatus Woesearchaeota archaeon]